MKNRRDFLKQSSLLVAGTMIAPHFITSCKPAGKNIGLQLYSLRDMVRTDGIQAVLEAVAAMGYKNLEAASYGDGKIYGVAPKEFKKMVDDLGMKLTSAHLSQSYSTDRDAEVMAWWDQAIEAHHEAGAIYMVQPSMPVHEGSPIEDLQLYCDYFSKVGAKTKEAGISFGYHNHSGEFKMIDDQVIFDYMVAHTDPDTMMFELDVYWCQVGGADPVDYLKKYPKRIRLTHIKDEKEIGASGMMDFEAIFNQMKANKIKDWYVEVERYSKEPVESVKESFVYLDNATYVK